MGNAERGDGAALQRGPAARHRLLGFAEIERQGNEFRRFNTSILVEACGSIVGKYRKIHLPGHRQHEPWRPFQHVEKRYFEVGDLGWGVWNALGGKLGMCICNDRRWPSPTGQAAAQALTLATSLPTATSTWARARRRQRSTSPSTGSPNGIG